MGERKVIFVGGTAFSGSTLLDMMLANDPGGFSCGEVRFRLLPVKRHNLTEGCGCGNPACRVWEEVASAGVRELYRRIFELFPDVRFVVDSSKDPIWIRDRTRDLRHQGIEVRNILIWKTPEEFLVSRKKRGMENGWQQTWIELHKRYFWLVDDWVAVRYADLVQSPQTFERVCAAMGLPYREGKERYWEHTQHTLFGNTSAKIHLYDKGSQRFQQLKQSLDNTIEGDNASADERYKRVMYVPPSPVSPADRAADAEFERVMVELKAHDVGSSDAARRREKFPLSLPEVVGMEARIEGKRVKRQLQAALVRFQHRASKRS